MVPKVVKQQLIAVLLITLSVSSSFLTVNSLKTSFVNSNNDTSISEVKTSEAQGISEKLQDSSESLTQNNISSIGQPTAADTSCKITGCNRELCVPSTDTDTLSSCQNSEANKCFEANSTCAVQIGGK